MHSNGTHKATEEEVDGKTLGDGQISTNQINKTVNEAKTILQKGVNWKNLIASICFTEN